MKIKTCTLTESHTYEEKYLTVGQVVEQLLKLDQAAQLTINIKQHNKAYGRGLRILDSPVYGDLQDRIDASYGGACITVHLPSPAIISKWPEKL